MGSAAVTPATARGITGGVRAGSKGVERGRSIERAERVWSVELDEGLDVELDVELDLELGCTVQS